MVTHASSSRCIHVSHSFATLVWWNLICTQQNTWVRADSDADIIYSFPLLRPRYGEWWFQLANSGTNSEREMNKWRSNRLLDNRAIFRRNLPLRGAWLQMCSMLQDMRRHIGLGEGAKGSHVWTLGSVSRRIGRAGCDRSSSGPCIKPDCLQAGIATGGGFD
jgi:hypothetical protein